MSAKLPGRPDFWLDVSPDQPKFPVPLGAIELRDTSPDLNWVWALASMDRWVSGQVHHWHAIDRDGGPYRAHIRNQVAQARSVPDGDVKETLRTLAAHVDQMIERSPPEAAAMCAGMRVLLPRYLWLVVERTWDNGWVGFIDWLVDGITEAEIDDPHTTEMSFWYVMALVPEGPHKRYGHKVFRRRVAGRADTLFRITRRAIRRIDDETDDLGRMHGPKRDERVGAILQSYYDNVAEHHGEDCAKESLSRFVDLIRYHPRWNKSSRTAP